MRKLLLLLAGVAATAQLHAQKTIVLPTQDGKPVYERAFALKKRGAEAFNDGKLFFAEYYGKNAPQIVVDDKESGRYAVRTTSYYHYIENPNRRGGRVLSLVDIRYVGDSCFMKVYDWQVQHAGTTASWVTTAAGPMPKGEGSWEDRDEQALVEGAAACKQADLAEAKVIDKQLRKMMDAFVSKLEK